MTKTFIEVKPEEKWFLENGYELETKDNNGYGWVWKNKVTSEWVIVSKTDAWYTVFFPTTGEFKQYPLEWYTKDKKGYEWTKDGVDKAIRTAFTCFPQWGTTFQIAETPDFDKGVWGVTWQKAGDTYTAWIKKDAVTYGDYAWIANQFAKSPVFA